MALTVHSFSVPLNLGPPRRCGAKDVKGCSCSGSAPSATISHALVLGMSGSLATLNGSPSAARAVTLTMLRLMPFGVRGGPVWCGVCVEEWDLCVKYV